MIIDLKRIFVNDNSSVPINYSLDLSDLEYMGLYPLKKPVVISGAVTNNVSLVSLKAEIDYCYEAPCDRCGAETQRQFKIKFEKALAESAESEQSDTFLVTPDMKLDLDELIYTEVVTRLPMKFLCSEECKGICSECGKNLNQGSCGCDTKQIDPRLAALAELLKDDI